jgi:hypothetical protein
MEAKIIAVTLLMIVIVWNAIICSEKTCYNFFIIIIIFLLSNLKPQIHRPFPDQL